MLKKSLSVLMCFSLCLTASCSTTETSIPETALAETSAAVTSASETTAAATPAEAAEETWPDDRYIPFVSGHGFSLIEEGYGTEVTDQNAGTCWAHAAATSLESNCLLTTGETIDIEPDDIVHAAFGYVGVSDPDRDGFHAMMYSMYNVGGESDQILAGATNGLDDGFVLTDSYNYDGLTTEQMQEALRTNGAFTVGYQDISSDYFHVYGYTTLNNYGDWADHAVTVVGYDDDFPAYYFDPPAAMDGAWLIQNSFSERWGDGGYFWLSYDTGFCDPEGYSGCYDYSHVCFYDGANTGWIEGPGTVTLANIFEYEGELGAVGTYAAEPGQEVTVRIYDGELTDGELLAEVTEIFEYRGYHTIELDTPVEVSTFTVVAEYEGSAPVEGESCDSYMYNSYVRFAASSEPGQSYISLNGEWIDLSSDDIENRLGIDFLPNNACIKALFI